MTVMLELSKDVLNTIDLGSALKALSTGKEVAEVLQVSPETISVMYRHALTLFKEEKYQDALDAFLLLNFLDQNNHDIWLGLGMSLQMRKRYESAIIAYELAAIHDPESPVPYFYLAKCLFAIHEHETALDAIELAIGLSEDKNEFFELNKQARSAKESLLRRQ